MPDCLESDIAYMLGNGNAGLRLELIGYGMRETVLLKLSDLPFVEVYQQQDHDKPVIDSDLNFEPKSNDEDLAVQLGLEFLLPRATHTNIFK